MSEAKVELWTQHTTQVKSGLQSSMAHTHNEMCESTHGVINYSYKQCSGMLQMCPPHDKTQATWEGCIFIVYRKIFQFKIHWHLPPIYTKNLQCTVRFFDTPVIHSFLQAGAGVDQKEVSAL